MVIAATGVVEKKAVHWRNSNPEAIADTFTWDQKALTKLS